MDWPQAALTAYILFGCILHVRNSPEPTPAVTFAVAAHAGLMFTLLWCGGFYR